MVRLSDEYLGQPWWLLGLRRINIIVIGLTALFIAHTRSAGVCYFAAGAVVCSLSVKQLKRIIRQPRPPRASSKKLASYGMPSTHSASMAFFAVYVILACSYLPIHPSLPSGNVTRFLPPLIIVPAAIVIAGSRIWLGKHTLAQVAVGCACGSIFALVWFQLWTRVVCDYGRIIEDFLHPYIGRS